MTKRHLAAVAAVAGVALLVPTSAAGQASTPWGDPDLQGVWDFRTLTPLERPDELAGKEVFTPEEAAEFVAASLSEIAGRDDVVPDDIVGNYNQFWFDRGTTVVGTRRTSRIVDPPDGRLPPLTPDAERRATSPEAQRIAQAGRGIVPPLSYEDLSPGSRCIHHAKGGPPIHGGAYNNNMQLFQAPGYVAILNEQIHSVRAIPLDGRPHLGSGIRQWMGDSRGRWDGTTLVVETTNFNGKYARAGRPQVGRTDVLSSEHQSLIERFTRVDAETLLYEYTVTDPNTWTDSWTAEVTMDKSQDLLYEYACHEGNYSMAVRLAGGRFTEREAAANAGTGGVK